MSLRAALSVLAVAVVLCLTASAAFAGTDYYCNSCTEYNNANFIDPNGFVLTYSYNHYLGTGNRWIGAGAVNIGSAALAYNEVGHSYSGTYFSYAYAQNVSGHNLTGNAHANYN